MNKRPLTKILVTGGAGFIGSEFTRQAAGQGLALVVVDKLTYAGDLARLKSIKDKFTFYKMDVQDRPQMRAIMKKERPRTVVHFAAESHVDRSNLDDSEFVRTNIGGTQNLLSACQEAGIEKFVHVSTDEVYGEIAQGRFRENSSINPNSPYAASKAASDLLVRSYIRSFRFPAIIVRPANNYGPWQYPEKFIPLTIYKALKHEKIPVYAKGLNVREWLHVADCAAAILAILDQGKSGEIYNIGSGLELKNIDLAKLIVDLLGKPKNLITFVEDRPGHDFRYALDTNKLRVNIGWQPKIHFEQGIRGTVKWYQENISWLEEKAKFLQTYWKQVYKFAPKR